MCRKQPGISARPLAPPPPGRAPPLPGAVEADAPSPPPPAAPPSPGRAPSPVRAAVGQLCERCDGKCVICDSYVRPCTLVRICDECNYGNAEGR